MSRMFVSFFVFLVAIYKFLWIVNRERLPLNSFKALILTLILLFLSIFPFEPKFLELSQQKFNQQYNSAHQPFNRT